MARRACNRRDLAVHLSTKYYGEKVEYIMELNKCWQVQFTTAFERRDGVSWSQEHGRELQTERAVIQTQLVVLGAVWVRVGLFTTKAEHTINN